MPCGFVGGQGPTAFGGYDWRKICKATQWCEAYESGGNNEIIRSFWGQKRPLLKTYFARPDNHEFNVWFLWYYLAHGNRGVIVWPRGWFQKARSLRMSRNSRRPSRSSGPGLETHHRQRI